MKIRTEGNLFLTAIAGGTLPAVVSPAPDQTLRTKGLIVSLSRNKHGAKK